MTFEGAIGIDLGTTYSCVAVFLHDRVEVIANDQGNRTTPSVVAFHNDEVLVGDAAKNLAARGASGVVYDAKRMIGRRYSDAEVQSDRVRWPFATVAGAHDAIEVTVPFRGTTQHFTPEQISGYVLLYLKECAERYLGKRVRNAVITVPAYFCDAQRERTKAAAAIAELHVVRMVNEPTAAALCYGLGLGSATARSHIAAVSEQALPSSTSTAAVAATASSTAADAPPPMQNVVVFDFGGGTFDVSVITVDGSSFAVRATAGDTHLGGQDIDDRLVRYVVDDVRTRYGVDLTGATATRQLAKVRAACERAKRVLSHATSEELALDGVLPESGAEYTLTLSRAKFDELNADVYARCMAVVDAALRDAGMTADEADVVILVGGSSRIVRVQELLRARFRDGVVRHSVHPDEAVAMGAAVQASLLSSDAAQHSARTDGVVLMDVVPLSIGVEVDDGKCDVLIPRNTTIPYRVTKEYTTVEDNQRDVDIAVYEGEHRRSRHNRKLGEFALEGITRARKGEPTITVTFSINADGLLTITAAEALAQATKTLVVQNSERLSDDEVRRLGAHVRGLRARDANASNRGADNDAAAQSGKRDARQDATQTPQKHSGSTRARGTTTTTSSRSRRSGGSSSKKDATPTTATKERDDNEAAVRQDNGNGSSDTDDAARLAAAMATLEAALAQNKDGSNNDGDAVTPRVRHACEQLLSYTREWQRRKLPRYTDARERAAKVAKVLARLERATRHAHKRTRHDDDDSHNKDNDDDDADEGSRAASSNAASDKDDDDDDNGKNDKTRASLSASQAKRAHVDSAHDDGHDAASAAAAASE